MKKVFSIFLCLAVLFAFTACSNKTQKNCHNCGQRIPATANFCEFCGTNTQTDSTAENTNNTDKATNNTHPDEYIENGNTVNNTEDNIYNIPKLSSNSQLLDTDWESTKIRMGQYLSGPNVSWNNIAKSNLYLYNIDSVNCYFDISTKSDIIGVLNSQIVFWGTYNLTQYMVKDLLPNDALTSNPYMTYTENRKSVYMWELQNGYLMIVALSSDSLSWYNQKAFCIVHAKNLDYLAPLNTANRNDITQNDNITTSNNTITGRIEKYGEGFQSYRIVLDAPISVEDWDGKHSCNVLYFYEDAELNGLPISEYADKTVTLEGTPENYRGGGEWFIFDPVLVN